VTIQICVSLAEFGLLEYPGAEVIPSKHFMSDTPIGARSAFEMLGNRRERIRRALRVSLDLRVIIVVRSPSREIEPVQRVTF
jgi:hypothetical protein